MIETPSPELHLLPVLWNNNCCSLTEYVSPEKGEFGSKERQSLYYLSTPLNPKSILLGSFKLRVCCISSFCKYQRQRKKMRIAWSPLTWWFPWDGGCPGGITHGRLIIRKLMVRRSFTSRVKLHVSITLCCFVSLFCHKAMYYPSPIPALPQKQNCIWLMK